MKELIKRIEYAFDQEHLNKMQAFDCRNTAGDPMTNIYDDGVVQVDYCPYYYYVEIFNLPDEGWIKLESDGYIRDWR